MYRHLCSAKSGIKRALIYTKFLVHAKAGALNSNGGIKGRSQNCFVPEEHWKMPRNEYTRFGVFCKAVWFVESNKPEVLVQSLQSIWTVS